MNRLFSFLRNQGVFLSGLILLLILSIVFWQLEFFREKNRLLQQTETLGLQFVHSLEHEYSLINQSLERMIQRGGPSSRTDGEEWTRDAVFFVESLEGLRQIAWVDNGYQLQKRVPALDGSVDAGVPVSDIFPEEPETGFYLWIPSLKEGVLEGFLLAEVDVSALVESILERETSIEIALSIGSRKLYQGKTPFSTDTYTLPVDWENMGTGVIEVGASREGIREVQHQSLNILLFGLFLTAFASGTFLLAWAKARKAKNLEKRFQDIFKASQDAVFVVDMQGQYIDVNPAAIKLTGYKKSEILNMRTREIHQAANQEDLDRIRQTGGTIRIDVYHSTGRCIPVELSISPMAGTHGERNYILGIARDLSGRLAYEKQLKKSLGEREILIRELYHRTKNNMQNIIALLQLECLRSSNHGVQVMMQDISRKILSMALVHQMLYSSGNLSQIDLKDYIFKLFETLQSAQKQVFNFNYLMGSVSVKIDTAIPLGMILSEWFSNTLKHGYSSHFSGVPAIDIGLKKQHEHIILEYRDNGDQLTTTVPLFASSGIGVKTIRDISEKQLGGSLTCEIEDGLVWRLEFNDDRYADRIPFLR